MKQTSLILSIALLGSSALSSAENRPADLVQRALSASPLVKAATADVDALIQKHRSIRSGFNPQLEFSPGVGFTNSNTVLSQEFDLFGKRSSAAKEAEYAVLVSQARLKQTQGFVAHSVLTATLDLLQAEERVAILESGLVSARELYAAVQEQEKIGKIPAVQVTRSELQVIRAEQAIKAALGQAQKARVALSLHVGGSVDERMEATWVDTEFVENLALAETTEVLIAKAELDLARSELITARGAGKPTFSAGVASDIWSFDKSMVRGENFGLQFTFRTSLDRGENRFAVESAKALENAAVARLEESRRISNLEYMRAKIGLETAESISISFAGDAVKKSESMLVAMRQGFEAGLVTLIEVLEAQRAVIQFKEDESHARSELRNAQLEMMRATSTFPGLEVKS